MRGAWFFAALCLAAATACWGTAPRLPAVPKLAYSQRTLRNGLRIISMPDRTTAMVSVQMWYDVGSKYDPPGRSGFAHLFEHLMFKATRNMPSEMIDRLTEDVGGYDNARTTDDFTSYVDIVPANHLERILWAEAERMGSLVVDQASLDSERSVVKEELRQRVLAPAYGRLSAYYVTETAFVRHPYGRPGIGSMADLDATTLEDLRAFHATYYRPDNAVLVVAGNFDQQQLDRWIDRYFVPLARPKLPLPRITAPEPPWTGPRRYVAYRPDVELPAIALSYQGPGVGSGDMPALMLADTLLNEGDSGRLSRSLQHDNGIVAGVTTRFIPTKEPGIFTVIGVLASGVDMDRGETAMRAEISRLSAEPVGAAELAKAKTMFLAKVLRGRETSEGRAGEIGKAAILYGSPEAADALLASVSRLTPDDIQRVARRYLRDRASIVIRYMPEKMRKNGPAETPIAVSAKLVLKDVPPAARRAAVVALAPPSGRIAPPSPGKAQANVPPVLTERRLANGLRLIVIERHAVPVIAMRFSTSDGSASDAPGQSGAARLLARVLTQGAGSRTGERIAADAEAAGGSIEAEAGWDSINVTARSTRAGLPTIAALLADTVLRPTLSPIELDKQRAQALDQLAVDRRDAMWVASAVAGTRGWRFPGYGEVPDGTPVSLKAIDPNTLLARHKRWQPSKSTLVVAGDITPREAWDMANNAFGDWRSNDAIKASATPLPVERDGNRSLPQVIVVDMPGAAQPAIVAISPGVRRGDPDYVPALVTNSVLAGGTSSRLSQEVRIKRGLTYGIAGTLDARLIEGRFRIATLTRDDAVGDVADLMVANLRDMANVPSSAGDLAARKEATVGRLARRMETVDGLVDIVSSTAAAGGDPVHLLSLAENVRTMTDDTIRALAARLLTPGKTTIIVAGNASRFLPALRTRYPDLVLVTLTAVIDGGD